MTAEVLSKPTGLPNTQVPENDGKYVYFASGSQATYRKVSEKPTGFTSIPTLDISEIDGSLEARKKIAKQIYDACHECGFFYIKNHGVSEEVIAETFELLKRFFALDLDTKMDAHLHKNPAIRGYEPMLETRNDPRTKGDIKEAFSMGDCAIEPEQDYIGRTGRQPPPHITKPQNIWPSKAPWWREGMYKYYQHLMPLSMKLVRVFALAFGLDEHHFDKDFEFPITGMRALYYPPTPVDQDAASVGLGAHADFSWITLVCQDKVTALEVLNQDGVWVDAPPIPGTFVCNVGSYLERQTNGFFPATVHRVRNKTGRARYSLPFFLAMGPEVEMPVLDRFKDDKGDAGDEEKYETINVGKLYVKRVLPARKKHPTAVKYQDVPEEEWTYDMLLH